MLDLEYANCVWNITIPLHSTFTGEREGFLTSLNDKRFVLKRNIPVKISWSVGFTATWEETLDYGFGYTLEEAIENLQSAIVDSYIDLSNMFGCLGPWPKQQLKSLKMYIRRKIWKI